MPAQIAFSEEALAKLREWITSDSAPDLFKHGDLIDWERTRTYALGMLATALQR